MSFTGAISTIETHLATATTGYAFTIQGGEPSTPPKKLAAWFYTGGTENPLIAETLTDHPFADQVSCRFYWPVSQRSATPSRDLELEVRAVARAFIAALQGDRALGDNVTDLTIGDVEAGWLASDAGAFRIVTVPLTLGFTDTEPIAR